MEPETVDTLASANYKVKNLQTNLWIFSDGTERVGDDVKGTLSSVPVTKITVNVNPAVHLGPTLVTATIKGKSGWYASVSSAATGQHVKWSKNPYKWQIAHNAAAGYYQIFVPGKDLYWFDNSKTGAYFILEKGASAKEREILFAFTKV